MFRFALFEEYRYVLVCTMRLHRDTKRILGNFSSQGISWGGAKIYTHCK